MPASKKARQETHLRPPLPRRRTRAAEKTGVLKGSCPKTRASSSTSLTAPNLGRDLASPKAHYLPGRSSGFSLLGLDLPSFKGSAARKRERSSSSTSETSHAKPTKGKVHSRDRVDQVMGSGILTLLEKNAVGPQTSKSYAKALEEFSRFGIPRGLDWEDADKVDKLTVDFLNEMYLAGHQAYKGDRLVASILHHYPNFGKYGAKKLPRMWRAVRGFRKLTPGKSRLAYPLPVWAAMAVQLKLEGYLRMALFVLVSVSSYARPSELLRMRLFSLVRPVAGVTTSWALLLSPEESEQRSKTGEFDVNIAVDSPYLLPWIHRFFTHLKKGHPEEALWDFNYDEYRKEFSKAAEVLGLDITPYQPRHSGPSIDRAKKWRSQHEVQKRGQWKSQKSVNRYEKSARLAATFDSLPLALQSHCRLCEQDLSEIMCGTLQPHRFGGTKVSKASM